MSGPNGINRSNFTNQADPMNDMDGWLESDYEDYGGEGSTGWGEDYGQSGYQGMEGEGPVGMSGNEAMKQLLADFKQVKANTSLDAAEKNKQLKQIKALMDQAKSYGNNPIPAALMNDISILEAETIQALPEEGEGGANIQDLKKEMSEFKEKIEKNPNLSDAKKTEYTAKIDQWLSGIDLNTLDAETLQPLFDEMKTEVTQASAFSPGVQSLAELTGSSPEELEQAFQAKGLNPSDLPTPPTQKVLEALASVSSELNSKLQAVKDAVKNRKDEIQKQTDAANAQNAANTACSSDNDNSDLKAFQFLYDAKYHQDSFSAEVTSTMKEAVSELTSLLQAAYPGEEVGTLSIASAQGFNDTEKEYNTAGLITFNGETLDIFSASDGSLKASTTVDTEQTVEVIGVKYDWEGSGDWEDGPGTPSLKTYNDAAAPLLNSTYDD